MTTVSTMQLTMIRELIASDFLCSIFERWQQQYQCCGSSSDIWSCWVLNFRYFAVMDILGVALKGRVWHALISNGWGPCAFRMLIYAGQEAELMVIFEDFVPVYWCTFPGLSVVVRDAILMWCWFRLDIFPRIFLYCFGGLRFILKRENNWTLSLHVMGRKYLIFCIWAWEWRIWNIGTFDFVTVRLTVHE